MTADEISEVASIEQPVENRVRVFFAQSNAQSAVPNVRRVEFASVRVQTTPNYIRDLTFNCGWGQPSITISITRLAIRAVLVRWKSLAHTLSVRQPSNEIIK